MKINFENVSQKVNADNLTAYEGTRTGKSAGRMQAVKSGSMLTDISGIVMENAALKGQGMTASESAGDLLQTMVGLQKNYMSVMSDSLSGDDIARMREEGFSPADADFEDAVTIVDKIKAELVKGGTYVPGYTDDVDLSALKEVAGSEGYALAMEKALRENDVPVTSENLEAMGQAMVMFEGLKPPTQEAVSYLLKNELPATIEGLHRAEYSGQGTSFSGSGYVAKAGEKVESAYYPHTEADTGLEALTDSIKEVVEKAGFSGEEILEKAADMVKQGIPLTAENLEKAEEISRIDLGEQRKELFSQMAKAIASGKKPQETSLTEDNSVYVQAYALYQEVMGYPENVTDHLAAEGRSLSIRSIRGSAGAENLTVTESAQVLHARRVFQEVRLQMTVEANIKLLQSDYSIETADLEDLVESLKLAEQQYETTLFGSPDADKMHLLRESTVLREEIPQMAIAVLGKVSLGETPFTLTGLKTGSDQVVSALAKASDSYETMMTEVRPDLGDNIKKAFRNVDAILEDLQLEPTELNAKAVRILGYNSMELTLDNITQVKDLYLTVQDVYHKMTPAAVLSMIREGENPLEQDLYQLDDYLSAKQQTTEVQAERYSSYLYRLEQNGEITWEERESYIGIYRFFKQLEKTDGAAIGAVLGAGESLSVSNLLKEMRSAKKGDMDYRIDDEFSGMERNEERSTASIDRQILSAYRTHLTRCVSTLLDDQDVMKSGISQEDTPEVIADKLMEAPGARIADEEIRQLRKQMEDLEDLRDPKLTEALKDADLPVTANYLAAAEGLKSTSGEMMQRLYRDRKESVKEDFSRITEAFSDGEEAQAAYLSYTGEELEMVEEAMSDTTDLLDLSLLRNVYRQLTLASHYASREEYHIPVEIGEEVTCIHLSILHEEGKAPGVEIEADTKAYGRLSVSYTRTAQGYAGKINGGDSDLEAKILEAFADIKDVEVFFGKRQDTTPAGKTPTAELYQVAKTTLIAIAG